MDFSLIQEGESLESLKGKTCCRQVKFYSAVYALASRWFCLSRILKAGPELFDYNWSYLCRHAPVKKQTQYANRAKAFAPHQNSGPAISEAAEPRLALSNWRIPLAGLRRGLARMLSRFRTEPLLEAFHNVFQRIFRFVFRGPDSFVHSRKEFGAFFNILSVKPVP
jgi:hypothetical protein